MFWVVFVWWLLWLVCRARILVGGVGCLFCVLFCGLHAKVLFVVCGFSVGGLACI